MTLATMGFAVRRKLADLGESARLFARLVQLSPRAHPMRCGILKIRWCGSLCWPRPRGRCIFITLGPRWTTISGRSWPGVQASLAAAGAEHDTGHNGFCGAPQAG